MKRHTQASLAGALTLALFFGAEITAFAGQLAYPATLGEGADRCADLVAETEEVSGTRTPPPLPIPKARVTRLYRGSSMIIYVVTPSFGGEPVFMTCDPVAGIVTVLPVNPPEEPEGLHR